MCTSMAHIYSILIIRRCGTYTSHDEPYTRVIEHQYFEMFVQEVYDSPKTVVSEEYSTEYKPGMEPYYPVNDDRNNSLTYGT